MHLISGVTVQALSEQAFCGGISEHQLGRSYGVSIALRSHRLGFVLVRHCWLHKGFTSWWCDWHRCAWQSADRLK